MQLIDNRELTKQKAEDFINNLKYDIYIVGRNKYSICLIKWLKSKDKNVVGYIDDYSEQNDFCGLPIFNSKRDYSNDAILNCIVEGRTIDVERFIISLNPKIHLDYFALQFLYEEILFPVDFLSNTDSILEKRDEYELLYHDLGDKISQNEFQAIINFRLNRDIKYLSSFEFKIQEQYFEEFVVLNEGATFIDGGGFDGKTTKLFAEKFPKYKKIFYFEPNLDSMHKSISYLSELENVEFVNKGLWNCETTLKFDNSAGGASAVSNEGLDFITTTSIDKIVDCKIDFIKLDIEGAEINAIEGARSIIKRFHPMMAICVYHNQNDFLEIPRLIKLINPSYKVFLRHYTQGVFETVMYFI